MVVKLGTSTLTGGAKKLSHPNLVDIVRQIAALRDKNIQVVVVSSGAVAAGRQELGFPAFPKHEPIKQMLAAVGQPRLMAYYEQYFAIYGTHVAQVLLTRNDLTDRRGFLNARNTLETLIKHNIIPIINENDTITTEEIRIGDNDNLSAHVANLIEADELILLTDQDGLYTTDPRNNPDARLIEEVGAEPFTAELWQSAGGTSTGLGTGGMMTKLQAADLARHGGTTVVIARGSEPNVLIRLTAGEKLGTRILPTVNKLEGRKRHILSSARATNEILIDEGAARALTHGGSLLSAGMTQVKGDFDRGDAVRILSPNGIVIAVGLSNYPSDDLVKLCGRQSSDIESVLGYLTADEIIHRNNMVLM
ncbi:MAG TPA: glutamate 5-kinase [Anaerolineaceae bacterium]|nr:glutamate 5-kinase [Anaerolineaceae bacterium]